MTKMDAVIKAAIPAADQELCEHILWGRTPFPMGKITARSLYKTASGFSRAGKNGTPLCDHCDNRADHNDVTCIKCAITLGYRTS